MGGGACRENGWHVKKVPKPKSRIPESFCLQWVVSLCGFVCVAQAGLEFHIKLRFALELLPLCLLKAEIIAQASMLSFLVLCSQDEPLWICWAEYGCFEYIPQTWCILGSF